MTFDLFLEYLLQHFNYSRQCINLPLTTTNCSMFWSVAFSISAFVMFLVFVSLIRKVMLDRAEFKAYQNRMIQRAKVAEPDEMKKVQWQPDYDFGDIDGNDLAAKMRQELNKSKVADAPAIPS